MLVFKIAMHVLLLLLGAGAGYLYYKFVGCRSGGCPLTSNAWSSVILGALFVYILLSSYIDKIIKYFLK